MSEQSSSTRERRDQEKPESLRLRGFSPSLTVDDVAKSLAFYVHGLGFTETERWEEDGKLLGVMVVAGACHLGLSQDDWAQGKDRTKGVGIRLWAETVQDLDAIAARLTEHGIEHDGPKESEWGQVVLAVTDPDGYKLSLTNPEDEE